MTINKEFTHKKKSKVRNRRRDSVVSEAEHAPKIVNKQVVMFKKKTFENICSQWMVFILFNAKSLQNKLNINSKNMVIKVRPSYVVL